jgi:tetratricopeptide (TPR) repeat protein
MKQRSSHKSKWFKMGALLTLLASLPLCVPAARSLAQTQAPPRQLQRPANPVAAWPSKAKRWALIIGVDRYRDQQIGALKGSENDARTLADALVRYAGFPSDQVILLSTDQPDERQPTRVNILRRLSNLTSVVPKDGLLLISFAGHGMERNGQAYLLPTDAQISEDISFLEETALSVARMKDRIRATGVAQVVILLDACRNDPGGRAEAPNLMSPAYLRGFNFDVKNREVQAFATIYATAVGQRAYEYSERRQGYFTWAIVEGLKGAAANEKGEVTLAALVDYVQNVVPKRIGIDLGGNKQQRPFAMVEGYKADQLVIAVAGVTTTPAPAPIAAPAAVDSTVMEMGFWDTIKNSNDPGDFQAYLDRFPNGTFAALARRRASVNGRQSSNDGNSAPVGPEIGNIEEALAQAERDLQDKDYRKAISVAEKVLAANPEQPKANLVLGLGYLQMKRYTNSVNYLSRAVALGEQVDIPIQHHHYVFLSGDAFCSGYLRVGKGVLEFHSSSVQKDDFSVPVSKVYEMVVDQMGGGRIRIKVGIDKGGKEDKRNLAFHPLNAFIGKKSGSSVNTIFCENCLADAQAVSQLLQQLIKSAAEKQEISAGGITPSSQTRSNSPVDSSAKTNPGSPPGSGNDHDFVLKELIEFERTAVDISQKGDRVTLGAKIVEEFTQTQDGKTYNKTQLLALVKPQKIPLVLSYEVVDVSFQGDVAVLEGIAVFRAQNAGAMVTIRQKFKDSFVRRDGKWFIAKSEVTTLK